MLEQENVNSLARNAIKVIGNTQTIGHIPERLAQKLAPLVREGCKSYREESACTTGYVGTRWWN